MYLKDPKNGKGSVTLTFLIISFLLFTGFSAAMALGHAESIGAFDELFYSSAALYFGRRFKIGAKDFSVSQEGSETPNE